MGKRARKKKLAKLLVYSERPTIYPVFKNKHGNCADDDACKPFTPLAQMKMKEVLAGEKFMWLKSNLMSRLKHEPKGTIKLKKDQVKDIMAKYLHRYDFELEYIKKIRDVNPRIYKSLQNRKNALKRLIRIEKRGFHRVGIKLPNLESPKTVKLLKHWDGRTQLVANLKLTTFSKKDLDELTLIENVSELSPGSTVEPMKESVGTDNVIQQINEDVQMETI